MQLYQCDYYAVCVCVDMAANYQQVPHQRVYLLNDDDATCHRLIGTKRVPIMESDDGRAMGENLEIVAELDRLGNDRQPHLFRPRHLSRPPRKC